MVLLSIFKEEIAKNVGLIAPRAQIISLASYALMKTIYLMENALHNVRSSTFLIFILELAINAVTIAILVLMN